MTQNRNDMRRPATRAGSAVVTIRAPRPPHVVHATGNTSREALALLLALLHELHALGAVQTLIFARRDDTPEDLVELLPPAVRRIELPGVQQPPLEFARALTQALRRQVGSGDADIVHLHGSRAGLAGRLALLTTLVPVRVVYSPQGLAFLDRHRRLTAAACFALEWLAGRTGCEPVASSDTEAAALARVCRHAPCVIENPVDPAFFRVARNESPTPLIVTLGRVCPQRAPEAFAELAVRIRVDHPNAQFVWLGSGAPSHTAVLRAAQVTLTGWLPAAQVRQWLARATVYVQASRWEDLPLAVIQAQAVGLPCVVSDVPGHRDVVIDGETGFVAAGLDELAAHVELLLREPVLRQAISAPARAAAERRFGRARFRQALARLYGISGLGGGIETADEDLSARSHPVKSARLATG